MKLSVLPAMLALLASSADAVGKKKTPPPKDIKPHLVEGFVWKDPFPKSKESFEPSCEAVKHFYAREYTLKDLREPAPEGLRPWAAGLKKLFSTKEYPGGWSGYDRHGLDRAILQMNYTDVPLELRQWVETQEREDGEFKDMFGVFMKPDGSDGRIEDVVQVEGEVDRSEDDKKVMIFAPGALYHVLPLWVAGTSECKGESSSRRVWGRYAYQIHMNLLYLTSYN